MEEAILRGMKIDRDELPGDGLAEYLTVDEVAAVLRIGIATAYRAVQSGAIPLDPGGR